MVGCLVREVIIKRKIKKIKYPKSKVLLDIKLQLAAFLVSNKGKNPIITQQITIQMFSYLFVFKLNEKKKQKTQKHC